MAEPLEINVNKSFVPYGGKVFASFENGWGVTVQVYEGETLMTQQEMTYAEYVALQKEALPVPLPDYPDPRLNRSPGGTNANGNTIGRVVGETAPAAVPASQANPPIEAETEEEGITGEQILDGIQLGLDVVGLIPVVGEVADIASAVISLFRGDYVGAGLSLLSAVPFVGYLGTAGKATRYGAKMAEASGKAGKEVAEKAAKDAADKAAKKKASEPIATNLNNATGGKVGQRQPPPNQIDKSWKDKIEGTAQRTGDDSAHQIRTYREAIKLAKDPDVISVNLDHGYNRALSQNPKTFSPNRRPDVTAVYNDKRVARVEVQSKTDNPAILRSRNSALDAQLRNEGFRPLPPKVVKPTRTPKP